MAIFTVYPTIGMESIEKKSYSFKGILKYDKRIEFNLVEAFIDE